MSASLFSPSRSAGFSLIDIMVGMVIGMLGIIVMTTMFSANEGQKRTTTGGSEAQSTGAIALFGLQREIRQAGYGIADLAVLGCDLALPAVAASLPAVPGRAAVNLTNLGPVTINPPVALVPAGDANTDTLLIIYGDAPASAQGDTITSHTAGATQYTVQAPRTFNLNDRVIATPQAASPRVACAGGNRLTLGTVTVATVVATPVTATAVANSMTAGKLFNLGQTPRVLGYAVRNGNLTVCDYMITNCAAVNTTNWLPIASNVVSLRAEYGQDATNLATGTGMDGTVDGYDQVTPNQAIAAPRTVQCEWARVAAVRVALVTRSVQFEQRAVSNGGNGASGVNGIWPGVAVDVSASPDGATVWTYPDGSTDRYWQHYRYKTFQETIPLRNVTWMGQGMGC